MLTALGRAEILARRGSARARATSLLNAQGPALVYFTLEAFFSSISLFGGNHLDETKSARLAGVRVAHDVALLNFTIFLKEARNLLFGQVRVYSGHEKVGSRVTGGLLVFDRCARLGRGTAAKLLVRAEE